MVEFIFFKISITYLKRFKMNIRLFLVAIASLFVLQTSMGMTNPYPQKPNNGFIVDRAGLIDTATLNEIKQITQQVMKDEKIPIVVVTIDALASYQSEHLSIETYAQNLFDAWGIGSQNRNYGVLLLISVGDRKARIELGKGWNHRYDREADQVMNQLMIPSFKQGQFSMGILEGVKGLDAMVRGLAIPKPKVPWWHYVLVLGFFVLIISTIISLFKNGRKGWGWALIAFIGVALFFMLRASARGGGGFGGGSSGGGGSTGSW